MKYKKFKILNSTFYGQSMWELLVMYWGTYVMREYRMKYPKDNPVIIDCGGNIGVSIIWFKKIYPKAKIISFEPDQQNYLLLKNNLKINNINEARVINAALSDKNGTVNMYSNQKNKDSWGKTIKNDWQIDKNVGVKKKVKSVKLSDYIDGQVDLIKVDIEGAEGMVIRDIRDKLKYVREIIMEHHDLPGGIKGNDYDEIINILEDQGFRYKVRPGYTFGPRKLKLIHAWKE